ncbi:MAG TPA: hypothetical protein VIF43_03005 [Patescibacteria group bacterium]|jgi:hypothetical protein
MSQSTFNPETTAQAEKRFWRAHNDKDMPRIRASLEQWTSELYGVDKQSSQEAVGHLFAAVASHDSRDWGAAVEHAAGYYRVIRDSSALDFDPQTAGELEVAWWRIHDELEHEPDKTRLVEAFSRLYAELFGISPVAAREAGVLKAQATVEHDLAEDPDTDPGTVDGHWDAAAGALKQSYQALRRVRAEPGRPA